MSDFFIECKNGNLTAVKRMHENGFNIHETIYDNMTGFDYACSHGRLNVVEYLINYVDVNRKSRHIGGNALFHACIHKKYDVAKFLIKNGVDIRACDNYGDNCFSIAFDNDDVDMIKILHDGGINIHEVQADNTTLLHLACSKCKYEIVKYLVENGIDINVVDNHGRLCIHHACTRAIDDDYEQIGDKLTDREDTRTKRLQIVKYLSEKGINLNAYDMNGDTCLHIASWNDNYEVVKYLLSCDGVNINAKALDGLTPIEVAASRSNTSISYQLLKKELRKRYYILYCIIQHDVFTHYIMCHDKQNNSPK